jgi:hypothetical protein
MLGIKETRAGARNARGEICVTMFARGFGLSIPISGAVSAVADLVGVAFAMVLLGLLFC